MCCVYIRCEKEGTSFSERCAHFCVCCTCCFDRALRYLNQNAYTFIGNFTIVTVIQTVVVLQYIMQLALS